MNKRWTALICAALLVLSLAACRSPRPQEETTTTAATTSDETAKKTMVTLPYTAADVLNPFKTSSRVNRDVAELIFDPLYQIDASFEAVPVLASDAAFTSDSIVVTVRNDVRFSSGELLTARDVVYSFQYAKDSPLFASQLENVFSAAADADETVRFTLHSPDQFALNCLDFPVMRFSTGEADMPTGTGRYLYQTDADGKGRLVRNEQTASFDEVAFEQILLYDISETVNALPLVEIGQLTCFLLDPAKQAVEKVGGRMETVHLNNLVFCGMNYKSSALQDPAVRQAIAVAVDKTVLSERAFAGAAQPTQTPFHPLWSVLSANMQTPVYDVERANTLLEDAGYLYENASSKTRAKDGESLSLRLLINSENEQRRAAANTLQDMLAVVGIGVEIEEIDYNSYLLRLQSGGFDLYLGEVKLPASMSLSAFFAADGGASFGIDPASSVCASYNDLCAGEVEMATFLKVFSQELPFLPLCFRDAYLYYTGELVYEGSVSENALFGNLYTWSLKGLEK